MLLDYSLTQKYFIPEVPHKKIFCDFSGFQSNLGKSSQNASIFCEKNYGGVKRYFFNTLFFQDVCEWLGVYHLYG